MKLNIILEPHILDLKLYTTFTSPLSDDFYILLNKNISIPIDQQLWNNLFTPLDSQFQRKLDYL